MEHRFGTIKVNAEIQDHNTSKIETLGDVTSKYQYLGNEQKEHVYAIYLNNGNEEIGDKLISLGTGNTANFDIKDVARTGILVKASALILVHNHPSGKPEATHQDIQTTENIHDALETVDIELLDHVIITRNDSYSMKRSQEGPFSCRGKTFDA